jgi:hypothetical protein
VVRVLQTNRTHGRVLTKFTNIYKAPLKTVTASITGFERLQIDVVSMKNKIVQYKKHTYKYILTIVDVFSRFVFLKSLVSNSARDGAHSQKPYSPNTAIRKSSKVTMAPSLQEPSSAS